MGNCGSEEKEFEDANLEAAPEKKEEKVERHLTVTAEDGSSTAVLTPSTGHLSIHVLKLKPGHKANTKSLAVMSHLTAEDLEKEGFNKEECERFLAQFKDRKGKAEWFNDYDELKGCNDMHYANSNTLVFTQVGKFHKTLRIYDFNIEKKKLTLERDFEKEQAAEARKAARAMEEERRRVAEAKAKAEAEAAAKAKAEAEAKAKAEAEAAAKAAKTQIVVEKVKNMDLDGDGKISKDEFEKGEGVVMVQSHDGKYTCMVYPASGKLKLVSGNLKAHGHHSTRSVQIMSKATTEDLVKEGFKKDDDQTKKFLDLFLKMQTGAEFEKDFDELKGTTAMVFTDDDKKVIISVGGNKKYEFTLEGKMLDEVEAEEDDDDMLL